LQHNLGRADVSPQSLWRRQGARPTLYAQRHGLLALGPHFNFPEQRCGYRYGTVMDTVPTLTTLPPETGEGEARVWARAASAEKATATPSSAAQSTGVRAQLRSGTAWAARSGVRFIGIDSERNRSLGELLRSGGNEILRIRQRDTGGTLRSPARGRAGKSMDAIQIMKLWRRSGFRTIF